MSRKTLTFLALLLIALTLGAAIGWVDSRPTWDDTGITAGALLLVTGLLGLSVPAGAWVWALAVGAWVPLFEIPQGHQLGPLFALVIAFIGAFGGALVRAVLNAFRRPSARA